MKIKFYENSWHNIKFSDLDLDLSLFEMSNKNFYNGLYKKFFLKYKSFKELNKKYLRTKENVAIKISKIIGKNSICLSIGCGIGTVENSLNKKISNKIDVIDFGEPYKFIRSNKRLKILKNLKSKKKYDLIYACQLFYSLEDEQILNLSNTIKKKLKKNGTFLTIDTSIENIYKTFNKLSFFKNNYLKFKRMIYPYYFSLFKKNIFQFYGYQRTNDEIIKIFDKNGFKISEVNTYYNQTYLLFKLNN